MIQSNPFVLYGKPLNKLESNEASVPKVTQSKPEVSKKKSNKKNYLWISIRKSFTKINIDKLEDVSDLKDAIKMKAPNECQLVDALRLVVEYPVGTILSPELLISQLNGGLTYEDPIIVRIPFSFSTERNIIDWNSSFAILTAIQNTEMFGLTSVFAHVIFRYCLL